MGSPSVWCPVRQAIEQYNAKIRREIERCLDHIKTDGSSFLIRLCMIGRKGERTNPTIMIFSANKEMSKKFEESVRHSGILDRYPELQLSSSTIPLEAPPIPLKSERRARRPGPSAANWNRPKASDPGAREISGPRMGRKIEFINSSETGPRVQHATGGLVVRVGDELYQITSFASTGTTRELSPPRDLKESDFESQSDPDDSGYEQDFTSEKSLLQKRKIRRERIPYRHGQQPLSSIRPYPCEAVCSPPPAYDGGIETSLIWKDRQTSFTKQSFVKSMNSSVREGSHYTLVKLSEPESEEACNFVLRGEDHVSRGIDVLEVGKVGPEPVKVLVVTSRGPISGTVLPDVASLRLRGSALFQTVHAIMLSEPLHTEDCGSAVIDAVTGSCYGHLVLTVEGHVVGYMVPVSDTMADIIHNLGKLPSLQLDRHTDVKHSKTVGRWKCINPRWNPNDLPLYPLGKCKSCSSGRLYSARSRAAAHLKRKHFPDESICKDETYQGKDSARRSSVTATELKEWTREITVTPLYAQVMQAESDSDSDYGNDVYDTEDELETETPPTSPEYDTRDRQATLEKENEELRRHNERMQHDIKVLEGDVDVLMEDRDELKGELEYLRRKLSERDAQLVEAELDAMLHTGCVRAEHAAALGGNEL